MPTPRRHTRQVVVDPYEVDVRLADLHLHRDLIGEAARRADNDARSIPPYGYKGQANYDAGSRAVSTIIEEGGTTDGGWSREDYLKIPVAMSADGRVAIHATAGSDGTGREDGDPRNLSLKGPHSIEATRPRQRSLDDELPPPDFYWMFMRRDDDGLWVELFSPLLDESGYTYGFVERIIIGNVDSGPRVRQSDLPAIPKAPEIDVRALRGAS